MDRDAGGPSGLRPLGSGRRPGLRLVGVGLSDRVVTGGRSTEPLCSGRYLIARQGVLSFSLDEFTADFLDEDQCGPADRCRAHRRLDHPDAGLGGLWRCENSRILPRQAPPMTVFGLPIHPLIVHATVVIVPAAALAVLLATSWPRFRRLGVLDAIGTSVLSVILVPITTASGESLEHALPRTALIATHAQLADGLLPWVIVLLVGALGLSWPQVA